MRLNSPIDGSGPAGRPRAVWSIFPSCIIATTTVSAALADWREQTRFLIGVAGLSVLVIAVMLFLIVRQVVADSIEARSAGWRWKSSGSTPPSTT